MRRALRQRGWMHKAGTEVRAFACGDVAAVPQGIWKAWQELDRTAGRPRG